MAVLITGGAGYIGSHVVREFVRARENVVVLDNLSSGHKWAVHPEAKLIEGDVGDRLLLERIFKEHEIDAVLHFAAHIEVEESVRDPYKYYENNTIKSLNLFYACEKWGVSKVVFSSTAAVYGENDMVLDEGAVTRPINPYGRSKLFTEWGLRDICVAHRQGARSGRSYAESAIGVDPRLRGDDKKGAGDDKRGIGNDNKRDNGMRYVILRYFNVAGADVEGCIGQATPNATHLIKVASQVALGRRPVLQIYGDDYPTADGTCVRDYIHVDDLARAHLLALEYLRQGGGSEILNCGYGHGASVLEVVGAMKEVSGVDFPVEKVGRRAGDPASLVANGDKIRAVLGWQPQYDDLNLICRSAFEWEKKPQPESISKV